MKKPSKRKKTYYLVKNKLNGYRYGAFPYTPEGLLMAKEYVRKHEEKADLDIEER